MTVTEEIIKLTPTALAELKRLLTEKRCETVEGVRIGVKGGGCSGLSYVLDYDLQKESDIRMEIDDLVILVDKAQSLYLMGTTMEFEVGLNNRGFLFINPNAKDSCGCGTSFSI